MTLVVRRLVAATQESTGGKAETEEESNASGDANGIPWILANIFINSP